ncbi:MAG TPA: ABC transporter permease subunit, partial [Acetobacteraceae bacterium]|nr:ABC transporter permease subunit [Acetobacteraceae bacterium]
NATALIARKEAGELLASARGLAWLLTLAGAMSVFALLMVGNTELSLLDNAQVVYDMAGLVIALGALLAIVVGADTVAGERERGSLVPLLLTPVRRDAILFGKLGGQAIAWAVMFAISIPYLWAIGSTGQNLFAGLLGVVIFGTFVVLGFGFLAMGLAARLGSLLAALLTSLIVLVISASPLLLGASLRQSAPGRMFDAINPFSAALNALDAVLIDSEPLLWQAGYLALALVWLALTLLFAARGFRAVVG